MIERVENILNSMGQRRMLFIIGDHLSGKTKLVKECLVRWFGQDSNDHYVDVGLYIKERISDGYLDRYKMYPEEFREDAEVFFSELVKERYRDNKLVVFDHMEFLLSEKYIGWIRLLDRVTSKDNTAIVVVPEEYEGGLPLSAYEHLRVY
jgi:hypothetical protein